MSVGQRRKRLGNRSKRDAWLDAIAEKGEPYKDLHKELLELRTAAPQAYRKRITKLAKELKL